jgi:hypothetical protein
MAWVATQNFRGVDRLLVQPGPAALLQLKTLGHASSRMLLRYHAAEQNRYYFQRWETAQLLLGAFLFFFLIFGTREDKFSLLFVLLMLLILVGQRFWLTSQIVSIGRSIDYVPVEVSSPDRVRFGVLHAGYAGAELVKLGLGLTLALRLILSRRKRASNNIRQELDFINKSDYRHIDR